MHYNVFFKLHRSQEWLGRWLEAKPAAVPCWKHKFKIRTTKLSSIWPVKYLDGKLLGAAGMVSHTKRCCLEMILDCQSGLPIDGCNA